MRELTITALLLAGSTTVVYADDWQQNILMHPTTAQLDRESRGSVFIYDGLQDVDVDRAMDSHFGRIDHMMFVRTRYETDAGESVADDGCD
ncbi:MAG: hypothetical protein ACWA5Q_09190 [bacterium]